MNEKTVMLWFRSLFFLFFSHQIRREGGGGGLSNDVTCGTQMCRGASGSLAALEFAFFFLFPPFFLCFRISTLNEGGR